MQKIISNPLNMPVIIVTGAKGQLGNELKKISGNFFGYEFIFTDVDSLDISDTLSTKRFIEDRRPDWIINCAAYNFVDRAEEEPEAAYRINAEGIKNIVNTIRDTYCHLIHFSTDYVFDGKASQPYKETDKPAPLSVYGESKLKGEKEALRHPWTMVIRTSWLYSSAGNNFVKTILRKAHNKEPLRVVNDQQGTPTWAADLAAAVMKIISDVNNKQAAFNGGIYHFSNEGSCTWYEFACKTLQIAGIDHHVEPVSTEEYKAKAIRPRYSVMSKKKIASDYGILIPQWDESLEKCIFELKRNKYI